MPTKEFLGYVLLLEMIYRVSSDSFQPLVMISSAIEELSSVLLHVIRNNEYFQFEPAVQGYAHPPVRDEEILVLSKVQK